MSYPLLTQGEVIAALAEFNCSYVETQFPGYEIWITGWGVHFTLSREPDLEHYDGYVINQVLELTIKPTLPANWKAA